MTVDTTWRDINRAADQFRNLDPAALIKMLDEEEKIIVDTDRLMRPLIGPPRDRLYFKQRAAINRQNAIQRRLALDFGAAHGWTLSRSTFGLRTLAEGKQHDGGQRYNPFSRYKNPESGEFHAQFDHPFSYRRNRKAAAIAAHLYGWPEVRPSCQELAAEFKLTFDVPDFPSWHNPGGTTLVVYIGPAGL